MLKLPNDSQHHLIVGQNGSGKSRAAMWSLAQRSYTTRPWIIMNHKREELIDTLVDQGMAQAVDLKYTPKKPGIYIYYPRADQEDETTELMWRIYDRENMGVYFDEGYMINPRDKAAMALYTQGRAKKIPTITLSQRPVMISRFAVSEASIIQVFKLNDERDRKTIQTFIPQDIEPLMRAMPNETPKLPPYHSLWYDVPRNKLAILSPVPDDDMIIAMFDARLGRRRKVI